MGKEQEYSWAMTTPLQQQIARRVRARRLQLDLSQAELARRLELNSRQTVTEIEAGNRAVKPEELVLLAESLGVSIDYFTDRFSAAGEAAFCFRGTSDDEDLTEFEFQAGRWLATYRELDEEQGTPPSLVTPSLSLSRSSSYEQARTAAEDARNALGLGRFPAFDLANALEREWGILVLQVDPPEGVSGAASRLDGTQVILVNRRESRGRRNFDLAHELFHLLTWDRMPPDRLHAEGSRARVEQLANNFASAFLMPASTVRELWAARGEVDLVPWIVTTSDRFAVSGAALKWRLVTLALVKKEDLPSDEELSEIAAERTGEPPPLFSPGFVARIAGAVEAGILSLRKASSITGLSLVDFSDLCRTYGRQLSYEV